MATLESTITVFTHQRFSNNNNYHFLSKSPDSIKLHASTSIPSSSFSIFSHNIHKLHFSSSSSKSKTHCYALQEVTEAATTTEEVEKTETLNNVKKTLVVFNLPWSLSKPDILDLFAQCGTVIDVEIVRSKDGKGKGFMFVTMDSAEEAQAAVDIFNAAEISGRIVRVEFAKEARYVIYASNLVRKARSTHLRDIFTENFKTPVSARVVFQTPGGKSAGYGFVSYHTEEEAEAAISALQGKEISGRILRVEFAKGFKKSPPPPPAPTPKDVIYASNLAWKARSTHLRDIFTENFKTPVSARVVFQTPGGKSAGYGFVSYHTEEEAEAAISALQGKELLGRPLLLKKSEKKVKEAGSEVVEEKVDDAQPEAGSEEVEEKVDDAQPEEL